MQRFVAASLASAMIFGAQQVSAADGIVDFGTGVPTLEQLHNALGSGGAQRQIEFTEQAPETPMAPPAPPLEAQSGQEAARPAPNAAPAPDHDDASSRPAAPQAPRGISIAIEFRLNSAEISPQFWPHISQIATYLAEEPNMALNIVGHTDASGSDSYNWRLSTERAENVRRALMGFPGVLARQLFAEGRGETQLRYPNPYDGRNRRVEFLVAN